MIAVQDARVLYRFYNHVTDAYEGDLRFRLATPEFLKDMIDKPCPPRGEWCDFSSSTLNGLAAQVFVGNVQIDSERDVITMDHEVRLTDSKTHPIYPVKPVYQVLKPVSQEELQQFTQLCRQECERKARTK